MAHDRCELLCLDLPRAERLRASRPDHLVTVRAASRAAALGDPTRLSIAVALSAGGELCVCDLAWVTERSENLVGHHLRALRDTGLARSRREHRIVFYSLTDSGRELLGLLVEPAEIPA
jgi:ArsR family transcriptional regulator, lead/cadmium/zinc/bismuth-responsive transcriptional repressor